jgi:hypothetical protein
VKAVETARLHAALNGVGAQAEGGELEVRDNAELAFCQLRDRPFGM